MDLLYTPFLNIPTEFDRELERRVDEAFKLQNVDLYDKVGLHTNYQIDDNMVDIVFQTLHGLPSIPTLVNIHDYAIDFLPKHTKFLLNEFTQLEEKDISLGA